MLGIQTLLSVYLLLALKVNSMAASSSLYPKTWSNRLGLPLTPVTTGVWAAERPFMWNGIDVGGRSAIVRTGDGGLFVHSPVNWTVDLIDAVRGLGGEVKYILSPNLEHLKYARQSAELFPGAAMYGCKGVKEVLPEIPWTDEITYDTPEQIRNSIDTLFFDCETNPFTGKPFFNEIVVFHKPSKTFICSDTYWNYPNSDTPNYFGVSGTGDIHKCSKVPVEENTLEPAKVPIGTRLWKFGMDRVYAPFYKRLMVRGGERVERYNALVDVILNEWEPEVIVPCHGDIIRGKELCREVLQRHFAL